ncbi:MAG: Asp-tRNA(Asn)/Glu-tRNA(Gln) amidotransferase subunit GatA [Spirochaetaceae bacterium]|jgi:aspartyl-tRNA(Asn)/glutamyl-tRNA(Gln) amidotransferase subunit A|nr:Asp-tRNA(Asn)/Glu-tRNA(Gln) amidotransferase subunit GatA [Spirochaetaceae bacterium]
MALSLPEGFLPYADEWEKKIGAFIEYRPRGLPPDSGAVSGNGAGGPADECPAAELPPGAALLVRDLPFAVKDNIAVKGFSLSCGSKLLEKFISPYTATAVRKLEAAGGAVAGKTNLDEFGMGSSTDSSALKQTNNPWDQSRVAGGSSGGSAAAVAAGIVPYALGSDTGGSVRCPASFCGVVGLKPGYGAVSRYGLVAYASSLEGIGILADTAARCRAVFSVIRGKDPMDQTSRDAPPLSPRLYGGGNAGKKVIGILSAETIAKAIAAAAAQEAGGAGGKALEAAAQAAELEPETAGAFRAARERLAGLGHTLVDVDIPSLKYGVPAYYTIAAAEASANLARFDGIRYGRRPDWAENPDDLIDKAREAGFGAEVKLRILLGTFVLRSGFQDRYYLRAQRIRAGIRANFELYLGTPENAGTGGSSAPGGRFCDAILMPVFPTRAFGRGETGLSPFAQKAADLYTCCANLAGLPALAFPVGVEGGLPVGAQLLGRAFSEGTLLDIVEEYEARYPFPRPAGYKSFWEG